MRGKQHLYERIHPHVGLPGVYDAFPPVCTIHGVPTGLTLGDLDGEFTICRHERQKVFTKDEKDTKVLILSSIHMEIVSKQGYEHWISRREENPPLSLISLIQKKKLPPECILPYIRDESRIEIVRKNPYFIPILSIDEMVSLGSKILLHLASYPHLFTARLISRIIMNDPSNIAVIIRDCLSYMDMKERKCLARFIVRKKLNDIYALFLDEQITDRIVPQGKHVLNYISMKLPIEFYISVCSIDHIRLLLQKYPDKALFIYDNLISKFLER